MPDPTPEQQEPSPTTKGSDGEPLIDTGKPVTDKIDFTDNNWLIKLILGVLRVVFRRLR